MYHRVTLGALLVILLVLAHSTWVVYKKKRESQTLMNISKERVAGLRDRENDLNQKIKRLDTDFGIEEEIRSKFSVTKEDESMVVVVASEKAIATTSIKKGGFWSRILDRLR